MEEKRVVILGLPADRQAVCEAELEDLKGCKFVFANSSEVAFGNAKNADVVVANIDVDKKFFDGLLKRGYEGKIIPVTTSGSLARKGIRSPGGDFVYPVAFRDVPVEVRRAVS